MKSYLVVGLLLMSGAAHADVLPKAMLGDWATDPAACAETASEIKMTIEQKNILMYEVAQTVKRVVKQKDGFLKVSGQSVDLDGKSPSSMELKLDGDKLVRGKPNGEIYHRCPKAPAKEQTAK